MAFVFKVFTLTVRTAAKPLAGRFEQYVLTHPHLRPRIVGIAQASPLCALTKQHTETCNMKLNLSCDWRCRPCTGLKCL